MALESIEIGVIGGSGFCTFPEIDLEEKVDLLTKYGQPSDTISLGQYFGERIAFLPRHGYKHQLPPHAIPYRANIMALRELGVKYLLAFCVAGSLKRKIKPGDFVIPDQFINLTWGRDVTFEQNQSFIHLPMGEPYSSDLRKVFCETEKPIGVKIHHRGTVAVIQGPRFNTLAESRMLAKWGGDIVNMTQYPECYFAKEQGLQYAVVAAITDFDVCLQDLGLSMTNEKITETSQIFQENIVNQKKLLAEVLKGWSSFDKRLKETTGSSTISYEAVL